MRPVYYALYVKASRPDGGSASLPQKVIYCYERVHRLMTNTETTVTLNRGQKRALLHIKRGKNVFVSGGAGTGKSVLITAAVKWLEDNGKKVLVCAPTGMAALKVQGITIHAAFGFPTGPCVVPTKDGKDLTIRTKVSAMLMAIDVLVVDEISMVRLDYFEAMVMSLRKVEEKTGKKIQLIVVGDMYQVCPVLKSDSLDAQLLQAYYGPNFGQGFAFQGKCWDECAFYSVILEENMRQKDSDFVDCLNRIRVGDTSRLDWLNEMIMKNSIENCLCLYAYKKDVDAINKQRLSELHGETVVFKTIIHYEEGVDPQSIDKELLNSIPKELVLKEGAQVIFTSTDYKSNAHKEGKGALPGIQPAYVNGMIGTVYNVETPSPFSPLPPVFVSTSQKGIIELEPVTVPVYSYVVENGILFKKKVATYTQLPIELAFAITIHKSQGQTYVAIRVCPNVFAPGQLYVALSRATSVLGVTVTRKIRPSDVIVNDVVKEFYERISEPATCGDKKRGRPPKNKDGSLRDTPLYVPTPLVDYVTKAIMDNKFTPLLKDPPYAPGRKHMKVPNALYDDLRRSVDEWKIRIKMR